MVTGGLRTIEVSRADMEDIRNVGDSPALYIQGKGREEKRNTLNYRFKYLKLLGAIVKC